jgi:hypothetical protein
MWELPTLSQHNGDQPLAKLRHSITDTDYEVSVFMIAPAKFRTSALNPRWFARGQWERLPLTGLARKILRSYISHLPTQP